MKYHDRLRPVSIGCLAIAVLCIAFDVVSHSRSQFDTLIVVMILFVTALEKIRLELRDLRDEFLQKDADAKPGAS
jgi:hypothetical protein